MQSWGAAVPGILPTCFPGRGSSNGGITWLGSVRLLCWLWFRDPIFLPFPQCFWWGVMARLPAGRCHEMLGGVWQTALLWQHSLKPHRLDTSIPKHLG